MTQVVDGRYFYFFSAQRAVAARRAMESTALWASLAALAFPPFIRDVC